MVALLNSWVVELSYELQVEYYPPGFLVQSAVYYLQEERFFFPNVFQVSEILLNWNKQTNKQTVRSSLWRFTIARKYVFWYQKVWYINWRILVPIWNDSSSNLPNTHKNYAACQLNVKNVWLHRVNFLQDLILVPK